LHILELPELEVLEALSYSQYALFISRIIAPPTINHKTVLQVAAIAIIK